MTFQGLGNEILSNDQMADADRLTIKGGVDSYELMTAAGKGAAEYIRTYYPDRHILILCGPGNNGGDGFVAARFLYEKGNDVRVACMVPVDDLSGDARRAALDWGKDVVPFADVVLKNDDLIVDTVFGTGFSGEFRGEIQELFCKFKAASPDVVAVDIPSGVNGTTGKADDLTLECQATVTFFRKKVGHMLYPGRAFCGDIKIVDIGIPDKAVRKAGFSALENQPELWRGHLPHKTGAGHKYNYGHAVIFGGTRMTGAACMAAHSSMRIGSGLCSIVSLPQAGDIYRTYLPNLLYEPMEDTGKFRCHVDDKRRNAALIGPGAGLEEPDKLKKAIIDVCRHPDQKALVLDADALTVFADNPSVLYEGLQDNKNAVITPHPGEFEKLFPDLTGSKIEKARQAAALCNSIVVLKGADTVIAAPDGRCVINAHSTPNLATAGTGDVLAGIMLGLRAQNMPRFEAACAAVWIHGEAAVHFGPGLMATDLPDLLPPILADLTASKKLT